MRTIEHILSSLPPAPIMSQLPAPAYELGGKVLEYRKVMCAVASMKNHTTDEGWQIAEGLQHQGYILAGHGLTKPEARGWSRDDTDIASIVYSLRPSVLVLQDKREWDVQPRDFRDPLARFTNVEYLKDHTEIFKLTILKDAHQRPDYHRQSAVEMGCHAWIVYYNPRIVFRLAPYVRPRHLIRTYHTVNRDLIPPFSRIRKGAILSGAVSGAYPLRSRLVKAVAELFDTDYLPHPGYHRRGCATPGYLKLLNNYKVAICTSSIYGYSLRKIIEAVACGCLVLTDLPMDEFLPSIDECLWRVTGNESVAVINDILKQMLDYWRPDRAEAYAKMARTVYDYRAMGHHLADRIEKLRQNYANNYVVSGEAT